MSVRDSLAEENARLQGIVSELCDEAAGSSKKLEQVTASGYIVADYMTTRAAARALLAILNATCPSSSFMHRQAFIDRDSASKESRFLSDRLSQLETSMTHQVNWSIG